MVFNCIQRAFSSVQQWYKNEMWPQSPFTLLQVFYTPFPYHHLFGLRKWGFLFHIFPQNSTFWEKFHSRSFLSYGRLVMGSIHFFLCGNVGLFCYNVDRIKPWIEARITAVNHKLLQLSHINSNKTSSLMSPMLTKLNYIKQANCKLMPTTSVHTLYCFTW